MKDFDTVIGSDILYDSGLFPSLLSTLDHVLMPGGHFFAVDPGRLGCSGWPAFADLIVKERPAWEIHLETLEEATKFADEHLPDVEIFLPQQRRHGLAVALGSCTQVEILPLRRLIAADEPYKMLRVKKPHASATDQKHARLAKVGAEV